ncbi:MULTISPECIES: hypothetical protein [unclassified Mesorhizobium]|uniref:hypothetical protein n=1 Tax=unclassified Mesorhizobium TaxID=325217 RepID=UPI000FD4ABC7|nr:MULTISPECIES: hypothetical protein [unclassified Mesorhizobium]RUU89476.1 hypothetical protein EOB59_18650 [Mesorhizobium sp. M7A.F.Ca.MR.176.00.0.0]RVD16237.1 hypothetical protein EN749_13155 [Mesorhizobium sp. M7A.F.Ca.ET.027.02.1.1]RWD08346.1 MAG: hypothetical protein EOS73_15730 [Mesorhizobium sp.]RWO85383.1 MAG: hypothetical protein EOQ96_18825 [Mesorhizobium sp.]RWP77718.1 MAG: hypothetical protein EOR11_31050 [Mesorhizobium sp.]
MLRFAWLTFVSLALAFAGVAPAAAADIEFIGTWQQVYSTGGQCADCRVVIRSDPGLQVDASNGWTADLKEKTINGEQALIGNGNWPGSASAGAKARALSAAFKIHQNRLLLVMQIIDPNGSRIRVHAVFERLTVPKSSI